MNAPATTDPAQRRRAGRPDRRRPRRGAGCREGAAPTLEDAIVATLGELADVGRAVCPVCAAPSLERTGCAGCGSILV